MNVELLAPAGSPEALIEAINSGADAVYGGVKKFNARYRAKNFTLDEFKKAVLYAHQKSKRFYLTLNTLIYNNELDEIIDILVLSQNIGIDAVIVQDLGLASFIKENFPNIKMHASTQMFAHNLYHIKHLKKIGFCRVILPRELTLNEISHLIKNEPFEYEIFIHGSMCFSFSGCCLFSSIIFGKSGNRGECIQPCRFRYNYDNSTGFPFSMNDLEVGNSLNELIKAGITSFKIEGRLKSTLYIKEVVSKYRKIIDHILEGKSIKNIKILNMRNSSKGYYFDIDFNKLITSKKPGTSGIFIGKVLKTNKNYCLFESSINLKKGSKLIITDKFGKNIYSGILLKFNCKNNFYKWFESFENIINAKYIYLISESNPTSRKNLNVINKFYDIDLNIKLDSDYLFIEVLFQNHLFKYKYNIESQEAINHNIDNIQIQKLFSKTGHYPFTPQIHIEILNNNIFIPLSKLKKIKNIFYEDYYNDFINFNNNLINSIKNEFKSIIELSDKKYRLNNYEKEVIDQIKFFDIKNSKISIDKNIYIELPVFATDFQLKTIKNDIIDLIKNNHYNFILPTFGWIEFFINLNNIEIDITSLNLIAGRYLYCFNTLTYNHLLKNNIKGFVFYNDIYNDKNLTPLKELRGVKFLKSNANILFSSRINIPFKIIKYKDIVIKKFENPFYTEYFI